MFNPMAKEGYSQRISSKSITPLRDGVIVSDMNFGETMYGVLHVLSDNKKEHGIKPRWAKVYTVGPKQTEISTGQWILISHGRWTRGYYHTNTDTGITKMIRNVDVKDIIAIWDGPEIPAGEPEIAEDEITLE